MIRKAPAVRASSDPDSPRIAATVVQQPEDAGATQVVASSSPAEPHEPHETGVAATVVIGRRITEDTGARRASGTDEGGTGGDTAV